MTPADGSLKVILAALIGNFLIAVCKGVASVITGSSAMFSEAIHSLVDTGNQGLLLLGMKRAKKPADAAHPFGYGGEIYFWSFVVAILIFAVGAGFSFYEGWHKIQHPEAISSIHINYIVLILSIGFESVAWYFAYKEFNKERGKRGYIAAIRGSKDPRVFTVLFEDSAAMLGLVTALIGITTSHYFNLPWADGAASMMIGLILALTAALLAFECKGLLIGESARPEILEAVNNELTALSTSASINEVLSVHFGPEDLLITISLEFEDSLTVTEIETIVATLKTSLKSRFPIIKKVIVEAMAKT